MRSDNPWKVLSSKVVYENPWMKVREDAVIRPDGADGIYGVMESRDSVVIAAVNNSHEVYLVYSFKYPIGQWSWGLPGGGGDDELPEVASKRELAEETGITANKWTSLGSVQVSSGLTTERMTVLLAQELTFGEPIEADDTETIEGGKFVSFDEVDEMLARGEIDDAQTVTGLYLALRYLRH